MNSLWFIIIIIILISLQSKLYKKYSFDKLLIERSFDKEGIFPGEKVVYKYKITNAKLLPITWLKIEEKIPVELEFESEDMNENFSDINFMHKLIFSIFPFQKVNRSYNIKALKRGYYELREMDVTSTNLLGTETYTQEKIACAALAVYPNIRDLRNSLISANTIQGDYSIKRWIIEDPMMIIGVREYNSSDTLRSINWKLTAKNCRLLVNKYDFTADKKIMLIFNMEKAEFMLSTHETEILEKAIEVAASLGVMLVESGIPTGVATNCVCIGKTANGIVEPDTGKSHIIDLLTLFSQMSYLRRFKSEELIKLLIQDFSWGTEIVLIAPHLSQEFIDGLIELTNIKITIIAFEKNSVLNVPSNLNVYYYCEEGEEYEAV